MKTKTRWTCQECGFQTAKAMGRCTECQSWGSFVEEVEPADVPAAARIRGCFPSSESSGPLPLSGGALEELPRLETGFVSLDEVLGGGLVPGAVILLAGDPGIGKSTLLLQLAGELSRRLNVLYVSGEESRHQLLIRARRLGLADSPVLVDAEQNVLEIQKHLGDAEARLAVIDSVQAIFHPDIGSHAGSVSQVRESAASLLNCAKANNITVLLVGHVTKDGSIAGPRVLEHMVDVVLQFEGDPARQVRIVRALKNRFGPTQEIAMFTMLGKGLAEVRNPSEFLLGPRLQKKPGERSPCGTSVIACLEGRRSLLVEVQALVGFSACASPRRVANGYDPARLLQLLAVLERRVGLPLSRQDVYVNIVGGLECRDPGGDLGVALAVATAFLDRSVDPLLVAIGEVGLTGEIRFAPDLERRLREAASLGFRKAIVPRAEMSSPFKLTTLEIIAVDSLREALEIAIPSIGDSQVLAEHFSLDARPEGSR